MHSKWAQILPGLCLLLACWVLWCRFAVCSAAIQAISSISCLFITRGVVCAAAMILQRMLKNGFQWIRKLTVWSEAIPRNEQSKRSITAIPLKPPIKFRQPILLSKHCSSPDFQKHMCHQYTRIMMSIRYGWPPKGREDGNLQTPINQQLFGQYHFPSRSCQPTSRNDKHSKFTLSGWWTNERTWIRRNVFLRRGPTMSEHK